MRKLLPIVLGFSACTAADSNVNPDAGSGTASCEEAKSHSDLNWIQTNVFTASCTSSSCHRGAAATAGHLSLESGLAHAQLVGEASTTASSWKRVVASNAAASYLLVAIGQETGPKPIDGLMPLGSPELCVEKRAAIQRWIEAGALP